jgi:hypothetical protein
MAKRNWLHGDNTDFVTVFARTPHLCAGAIAGLGSALWLNLVGPFAGLVAVWGALILVNVLAVALVAVLAMLVTTAGTLLVADLRADAANRQAWAEIGLAVAELGLPAGTVAPSHIDPRYLTATDNEALRSIFREHRFTSPVTGLEVGTGATCTTRIAVATGGFVPVSTSPEIASNVACSQVVIAAPEVAISERAPRKTDRPRSSQVSIVEAPRRSFKHFAAKRLAHRVPLVANGGIWSRWSSGDKGFVSWRPLHARDSRIVVVCVSQGDRDGCPPQQDHSRSDSGVIQMPSCRGPPAVAGQRLRRTETVPVQRSADEARNVPAARATAQVDPIVHDNLGHPVPVHTSELDVIETYLDQALQDLLAPGEATVDQKEA